MHLWWWCDALRIPLIPFPMHVGIASTYDLVICLPYDWSGYKLRWRDGEVLEIWGSEKILAKPIEMFSHHERCFERRYEERDHIGSEGLSIVTHPRGVWWWWCPIVITHACKENFFKWGRGLWWVMMMGIYNETSGRRS